MPILTFTLEIEDSVSTKDLQEAESFTFSKICATLNLDKDYFVFSNQERAQELAENLHEAVVAWFSQYNFIETFPAAD